tara:strand:+ start:821 stop:1444 length:624 start_codon:yes stop_codon:yes gene_type:complete
MENYNYKIKNFLENQILDVKNPKIIEFGVREGRSTKMFLDLCRENNGELYSIDIDDYSNLYNDKNWKFIQTRDDNFKFLEDRIPNLFDIIYLDSLHEAQHVEKIFYHYFSKLRINGFFFIDDISWLPYLRNEKRSNFYCEINNKETFEKILSIFQSNQDSLDLSFSFISSGMCKILKKKDKLNPPVKIETREKSLKNLMRKMSNYIK